MGYLTYEGAETGAPTTVEAAVAPQYEAGMSKYPLGQYRDRIGVNIEAVYQKVVKKR